MIEQDSVRLLRECDAGVKMGISAIEDVMEYTRDGGLRQLLSDCREQHDKLGMEIRELLDKYGDTGKDPNPMAKGMSWIKTNVKLKMEESDNTIADLITDGCNMGVKSLCRYFNQYAAADEVSKDITKRLINLEGQLALDLRDYL